MIVFRYDKTFDGLLTAVFDAYSRKVFPDKLLGPDDIEPMFTTEVYTVVTQDDRANRVWNALQKKISKIACNMITHVWLSELPESDDLLFRYMRKNFDHTHSIEMNFTDPDVLEFKQIAMKVSHEKHRVMQFIRFQKAADDIYFAPFAPLYNALPLALNHLKDRFRDQKWIVYDVKRDYGYYYDLNTITEMTLDTDKSFKDGKLDEKIMAEDEKLFQDLWKAYFKALTIKERINLKLHRQNMPKRFWKYMTEKQ